MFGAEWWSRYFRLQTLGLLGTWAALMFLEWAKPQAVGNTFNPQSVLLGFLFSATITAFLPLPSQRPKVWRRRAAAIAVSAIVLFAAGAKVSSPIGWMAAVVVWGSLLAAWHHAPNYD